MKLSNNLKRFAVIFFEEITVIIPDFKRNPNRNKLSLEYEVQKGK